MVELVAIFAASEEAQGEYFPRYDCDMWYEDEVSQVKTRSARLIALLVAITRLRKYQDEASGLSRLIRDFVSLAKVMTEVSASWEWLVWHPKEVAHEIAEGVQVDLEIYGLWSVLRRLSESILALSGESQSPPSFTSIVAGRLSQSR